MDGERRRAVITEKNEMERRDVTEEEEKQKSLNERKAEKGVT